MDTMQSYLTETSLLESLDSNSIKRLGFKLSSITKMKPKQFIQNIDNVMMFLKPYKSMAKNAPKLKNAFGLKAKEYLKKESGMKDAEVDNLLRMTIKAIITIFRVPLHVINLVINPIAWIILIAAWSEHKNRGGTKGFADVLKQYIYGAMAKWTKYESQEGSSGAAFGFQMLMMFVLTCLVGILAIPTSGMALIPYSIIMVVWATISMKDMIVQSLEDDTVATPMKKGRGEMLEGDGDDKPSKYKRMELGRMNVKL